MKPLTKEEQKRVYNEMFESNVDGFFKRTRICKKCQTPTKFDIKRGRYYPKGCFQEVKEKK